MICSLLEHWSLATGTLTSRMISNHDVNYSDISCVPIIRRKRIPSFLCWKWVSGRGTEIFNWPESLSLSELTTAVVSVPQHIRIFSSMVEFSWNVQMSNFYEMKSRNRIFSIPKTPDSGFVCQINANRKVFASCFSIFGIHTNAKKNTLWIVR